MVSRVNSAAGTTENFCYDVLNRLTDYAPASSCTGAGAVHVGYYYEGNVIGKSDVCANTCYTYPLSGSVHPHAVSGINGTFNGVYSPTFSYDPNGNMTSGAGRSIPYWALSI